MNDTKPLIDFCTICGRELVVDLDDASGVAGWCHEECCPDIGEETMN